MGTVDFKLDDLELRKNIAEFGPTVNKYITLTTDFAKGNGVDEMKLKAPWTDDTGAARAGLNGDVTHEGSGPIGFTEHTITFAHGVDYGIWLEVANSGKYQIIMPTVLAVGKAVMETLRVMFDNLDKPPHLRAVVDLPSVGKQGTSQSTGTRVSAKARQAKRTTKGSTTKRTRRTK